jgi:hypothetical protein
VVTTKEPAFQPHLIDSRLWHVNAEMSNQLRAAIQGGWQTLQKENY